MYKYSYQGLYDFLIRPIINNLEGINTIYISNCGILNKFNLSALLSESNKSLSEKFHVFVISSTSEFVNSEKMNNNISKIDKIYSYGGINYGNTQTNISASQYFSRSGISKWSYLPGTLSEVNFIDSLSRKNRIKSVKYTGENATEYSIYKLVSSTSPYILHIASHGFFLSNKQTNSNLDPLNLTGVLFSGANNNWNKNKITTKDSLDGILLGSELCDIDLSNCSLAILSACETGVGKIMNNEGVFGLQRALKLAGVKQCIVSLWKVPDQQTSELFKLFYTNFINGGNIHDSFYKAQISLKEKYVLPIYWAGFVLIE